MELNQHRVLIVEDEIFIAIELETVLRDAGAEVVGPAMSAPEALRLIEKHTVTAAILDVRLGNHDSLPVARRLHKAGIPFVFHTGKHSDRLASNWPSAPIVKKPALTGTLIATLIAAVKK